MNTSLRLRLIAVFFLVLFSIITILPSFFAATPDWWKKYLAPGGLHLGLDLQWYTGDRPRFFLRPG